MSMRTCLPGEHIHDYAAEARCRVAFLADAVLAISEKPELSPFPNTESWAGLYYIVEDLAGMLRTITEKAKAAE